VRQELDKRFGAEQVHEAGLKIETTLDLDLQKTANRAVPTAWPPTSGAAGWVGRESWKTCSPAAAPSNPIKHPDWVVKTGPGDYVHAVVTRVLPLEIHARVGKNESVILPEDWQWTGQRWPTPWSSPAT
jgi:penicillin-binding protein 1A